MKGKRTKKLLALIITAAMAVMMMGIFANAAGDYAPATMDADHKAFVFTKYLVIPKDMGVPSLEFEFEITPGQAVEATNGSVPIYAGNDTSKVSNAPTIVNSAQFSSSDSTIDGAANDGIANSTEKKYASKTVTVNFENVEFTEPGVYRWVITEKSKQDGSSRDTTPRTLDVNVQDDNGDGTLEVVSYTMYFGAEANIPAQPVDDTTTAPKHAAAASVGDKVDSFVNSYPSNNCHYSCNVSCIYWDALIIFKVFFFVLNSVKLSTY